MTDGDPRSSDPVATGDSVVSEAAESGDRLIFPPCPRCGERVITVTSRGPRDHVAGPCGCQLTRGEVKRL
ncbi:hypothetical protein [Natrinema salinisoli]|uniref:hypothetical protein n=1 Tax=Natrinema salinisoli TaxID=2878535 RepID=UPI001CF0689F|nr:hypothetical protein [Natrinema salinisoli]